MIHASAQRMRKHRFTFSFIVLSLSNIDANFLRPLINLIMWKNNLRFVDDEDLVHLLLYGNGTFKLDENQGILKATINFIRKTSRFSQFLISYP